MRVSPKIRESEYWTYNGRPLDRFPKRLEDNPSRQALARRMERLVIT